MQCCFLLEPGSAGEPFRDFVAPPIERLHRAKDDICRVRRGDWLMASRNGNPNEGLNDIIKDKLGYIVCRAEPKMWEYLHAFPALLALRSVRPLHLADAPGGFANAVLRYCSLHKIHHNGWVGVTLRGTEGALAYDERVLKRGAGTIDWCADGTGDLTSPANLLYLYDTLRGSATLVTADGGFDVSEDPSKQEERTALLVASEAVAIIGCCAPGGAAIMKTFECASVSSQRTMALLVDRFEKVFVTKGITSRPANSERFIVCLGARGPPPDEEAFRRLVAERVCADGIRGAPPRGMAMAECALAQRQAISIERTLRSIERGTGNTKGGRGDVEEERLREIAESWININPN